MPDQDEQEGSADDQSEAEAAEGAEQPKAEDDGKTSAEATAEGGATAEAKPERSAKNAKDEEPAGKPAPPPGGIADLIKEALPDVEVQAYQELTHVVVEIGRDEIEKAMPVLRDDPRLELKYLRCLFGVDHQDEGLEVIYQLLSLSKNHDVAIKTKLPQDDAKIASVAGLWHAANWHERETRDMFGIVFEGHPHLVPLLLPEDMIDHFPLRKDNPLAEIEEWQADFLGEDAGDGDDEVEE